MQMRESEQTMGAKTEEQLDGELGQRIDRALEPRGLWADVVSLEHHHREMGRMYDEGVKGAALIAARGGDVIGYAHKLLKPEDNDGCANEIRVANSTRVRQFNGAGVREVQTQAAPSPDYGTKDTPFGKIPPPGFIGCEADKAFWAGSQEKTDILSGKHCILGPSCAHSQANIPHRHIDSLEDWLPRDAQERAQRSEPDTRLSGVRLGDVHRRLEAERRERRAQEEIARLRCEIERNENAAHRELKQWRAMFSRPEICRRTLDQLREAHDGLQRRLEKVRSAIL